MYRVSFVGLPDKVETIPGEFGSCGRGSTGMGQLLVCLTGMGQIWRWPTGLGQL